MDRLDVEIKDTIMKTLEEFKRMRTIIERSMKKEDLYRFVLGYPKKWSKRKVKKRGKREYDMVKIETALVMIDKAVERLGTEHYERLRSKCDS